jgi:hypothetical protein
MNPETRRRARNVIPALFGVACIVGVIVHEFVIVAAVAAVVSSILYTAFARGGPGPGEGRQRNRNRNRNRS